MTRVKTWWRRYREGFLVAVGWMILVAIVFAEALPVRAGLAAGYVLLGLLWPTP